MTAITTLSPTQLQADSTRAGRVLRKARTKTQKLFSAPNHGCSPADFPISLPDAYHRWLAGLLAHTLLTAQGVSSVLSRQPLEQMSSAASAFFSDQLAEHNGRSLIGPDRLNDKAFSSYVHALAPNALADSRVPYYRPTPSPKMVPYLLGGLPWSKVEQLIDRLRPVFGMDIDSQFSVGSAVTGTMVQALTAVGLGSGAIYEHEGSPLSLPEQYPHETDADFANRLAVHDLVDTTPVVKPPSTYSLRQHHLRSLPTDESFASILFQGGKVLYRVDLQDRMQKFRSKVVMQVVRLFAPCSEEMTPLIRHELTKGDLQGYQAATRITADSYRNAVRMAFTENWYDLELGATIDRTLLDQDVEVALARAIIAEMHSGDGKLSRAPQLSGLQLLGLALLTGVPVLQFLQFIVDDRARRGECVLVDEGVEQIMEIIRYSELSAYAGEHLMEDLQKVRNLLHFSHANLASSRIAYRLRVGARLLWDWSGRRSYHLERDSTDEKGPKLRFREDRMLSERD